MSGGGARFALRGQYSCHSDTVAAATSTNYAMVIPRRISWSQPNLPNVIIFLMEKNVVGSAESE